MEFSFSAMEMTRLVLICSMLFIQLHIGNGLTSPALTPPEGNSLKMKLKANDGKYVYKCQNYQWIPVLATANLVNASDYKVSLGNYSLTYRASNPKFLGIFYLINAPADSAESGMPVSIVSGKEIASEASDGGSLPQVLAEASYHENYGIGSRVSYIQRLSTKGGLPPQKRCTTAYKNRKIIVPFEAEFWFYAQDFLPPSVPSAIAVPSGRMVMGFFCKGVAVYRYDGSSWLRIDIHGKLYDVPGGNYVGNYYVKPKPDSLGGNFCLETNNPYAWSVVAKIDGHSVQVSPDSLSWSIFKITSSSGNTSLLGPFDYFQMIATRGGLPPTATNATRKGTAYRSVFTNLFWIYSTVNN